MVFEFGAFTVALADDKPPPTPKSRPPPIQFTGSRGNPQFAPTVCTYDRCEHPGRMLS